MKAKIVIKVYKKGKQVSYQEYYSDTLKEAQKELCDSLIGMRDFSYAKIEKNSTLYTSICGDIESYYQIFANEENNHRTFDLTTKQIKKLGL